MGPRTKKNKGIVEGLKTEWALFWETILGDEPSEPDPADPAKTSSKDPFVNGKLEQLSLEQIKVITKALSSDRKKLNQRLESLNKEIELNSAKLESLKLVGGEHEETYQKLNELSDLGQSLSEQLHKINDRLKSARQREDAIKKAAQAEMN